ncbi:MAG: Gfo/Idh/MocA family oxidoreductase [Ruminococcaceae bacterium]|nr:Gfo/Idh/MocA family oxidoreductase [Oscillospiraceae bacterium]
MDQITVAVIGLGYMGKRHLEIWHQLGARVVLCSRDDKSSREYAETYGYPLYTDYMELLEKEKPDAVSICLPTALHYEAVRKFLTHGIAVLCEKPFTTDSAEAEELCRLAEEKNVLLMVGHVVRFTRAYAYLKRCIEEKRFGALKMLEMHRHTTQPTWSAGNWLADVAHSGGAAKDLHIHESDILCHYLGIPQSVLCTGDYTACTTVYTYPDYPAVSASASWRSVPEYPFTAGYDAVFEHAVVQFADFTVTLHEEGKVSYPLLQEDFPQYLRSENALENEIVYFYHCLITGETPELCPPRESLAAMRINEAELRSLQSRCPVSLGE